MALPPRVFFSLYEVSFRWDCSVADIAGWASQGKLKIMTGIGLVRCGDATVAGPVTLSPMDLLPLLRRSGPGPSEGVMQRILPQAGQQSQLEECTVPGWPVLQPPPDQAQT